MASSADNLQLSSSLGKLGTETAYAVALEAKALIAEGKKVYPMHIGDLNFSTPACIKDAARKALDDGKTGYCPAAGIPPLREALAKHISSTRGVSYGPNNVSVQPGGKPVIGKFLAAVLEEGDEVLYPSPGYPIYESQISYLGGKCVPYGFVDGPDGFSLDLDALEAKFSDKTKVLIFNNYANPVGYAASEEELERLARMAVAHNVWVLSDEAYWNVVYDIEAKSIASQPGMAERTVILFTCSKSWAMTGWRCGAAIGPESVIKAITKFNTNAEACTTHFVQYAAAEALSNPAAMEDCRAIVATLKERRDALVPAINAIPGWKCHMPTSTFYLFINVTEAMAKMGMGVADLEAFRQRILADTGVSFTTREHFGRTIDGESDCYIRFAYSGIDADVAVEACGVLKDYFEAL
ncbi:aspartate aminotransferase [Thecamonas trahens ATCC 50062]|uniref:Aspartate aminotransferase n=1 Tax=Thecamonas trahens ATCC 50062 TaxID=461836 RepID=A0A0L0DU96_THETB|nr:aspartate aminotransferase [Thecamonas trahens ATCC 50062]KNC55606.1 aspartate aminotransferase [Thecamonas trahens ATCC 50062]|eukprot:XP_013761379.1 aspartate aminotransferase [Thecamonas trahens ATCC 50062]